MIRWFQKIAFSFFLFWACTNVFAHVPNALGFKTQEQIDAGLEAQTAFEEAQYLYNHCRPHTSLGYRKPAEVYAAAG